MQYRSYEKLSFVYTKIEKRSGKQQRVLYLQFNSNYLGRIKQIASLYAKIYLEESGENDKKSAQGRFYWMGLGAFAAKQVYCGVLALDDISTKIGSTLGLAGGIATDDLKFFKEEMLKGNLWLFFDIYPSHLYYKANPKGFFDCHHTRDAKHYGDKIYQLNPKPNQNHVIIPPMAYSVELKQKALDYLEVCGNINQVATAFGVDRSTIRAWVKKKQSGNLACCSGGYRYSKIDKQKLLEFIQDNPDAYLYEIAQVFDCSNVAVFKALKRMNITLKKRPQLTLSKTQTKSKTTKTD
nr:IS630 transposase-related protein [Moraxella bovis]